MLSQRLRRWTNIETALIQRLVFAGPLDISKRSVYVGLQLGHRHRRRLAQQYERRWVFFVGHCFVNFIML